MVEVPPVKPAAEEQDIRLLEAARRGEVDRVEELIREGVDLNAVDDEGHTPLIFAAMSGRLEVAAVLKRAGANTHLVDHLGYDTYHAAMFFGDFRGMTTPPFDQIMDLLKPGT